MFFPCFFHGELPSPCTPWSRSAAHHYSPSPSPPLTCSFFAPLPLPLPAPLLSSLSRGVLQIEYLGTPDRVLHAVLAGDADVGLVHSGFLEEAAQQLKVAWEDITVLSQDVVRNYGERYPYYSSTPVYPDYALVLADTADPAVCAHCALQFDTCSRCGFVHPHSSLLNLFLIAHVKQYKEYVVTALLDANNATHRMRFSISGSYAIASAILVRTQYFVT